MRAFVMISLALATGCAKGAPPPPASGSGAGPVPAGARMQLGGAALRDDREIAAISVSADGRFVATANGDDARIWDAQTGALVRSVRAAGLVNGFTFVGARLFYQDHGEVAALDVATGAVRTYAPCAPVVAFAVTADAKSAAVACESGQIVRVELAEGAVDELATITRPRGLTWSADGSWLAVIADFKLILLDVAARVPVPAVVGRVQSDARFAPSGNLLAYFARDEEADAPVVALYDLTRRAEVRHIALPDGGEPLNWSQDGKRIAAEHGYTTLIVVDVATGVAHSVVKGEARVRAAAFADPAGDRVWIAYGHTVELWDVI